MSLRNDAVAVAVVVDLLEAEVELRGPPNLGPVAVNLREEGVIESLLGGDALLRVEHEHLLQQVQGPWVCVGKSLREVPRKGELPGHAVADLTDDAPRARGRAKIKLGLRGASEGGYDELHLVLRVAPPM